MLFIYFSFVLLFIACLSVMHFNRKADTSSAIGSNPIFKKFQNIYFAAYLTALFADWLQSPYQYKLFSHYGFEEDQIAILYVCGFASTVVLGSWAPVVADRFGRKKLCITFTIIYSVASLIKLSSNYFLLLVGRVLGGIATSLLFSTFESWYHHEHVETHDFPKEWIPETFEKVNLWNGFLAIIAGLVANCLAEWMNLGPVSPFVLAVPILLISGVFISFYWTENRSQDRPRIKKSCLNGLNDILKDPKIFLTGLVQSLFESTMYIFIFIWTPVLDKAHVPLGLAFACFMASTMCGAGSFMRLYHHNFSVANLLASSVILAAFGNVMAAFAAEPEEPKYMLAFFSFLMIEFSVGMYFRAMTIVRARIVPQSTGTAINSWFRVPLNLIACVILMCLHNDVFHHGNRLIFIICALLLVAASIFVTCLVSLVRLEEDFVDLVSPKEANNDSNNLEV